LFADEEKEYKEKAEESGLHIIFDELDAICRQRGSENDATGVGDSVVNQLLSKVSSTSLLSIMLADKNGTLVRLCWLIEQYPDYWNDKSYGHDQ